MGTSTPVFGLRPTRSPLLRTMNEPKEESFTVSPAARLSQISARTRSTSSADSVRERPTFWYTASLRSALVIVLPAIELPSTNEIVGLVVSDDARQMTSYGQPPRSISRTPRD